jgi:putative transposase
MVRPISNDLHKRAVAAVAEGENCRSVASRFGGAVSSVVSGRSVIERPAR